MRLAHGITQSLENGLKMSTFQVGVCLFMHALQDVNLLRALLPERVHLLTLICQQSACACFRQKVRENVIPQEL